MLKDLLILSYNYVYVHMSVFGYVYPGADSHRGLRSQIPTRYRELDSDHPEKEISLTTEPSC